jgi:hypothetical protein
VRILYYTIDPHGRKQWAQRPANEVLFNLPILIWLDVGFLVIPIQCENLASLAHSVLGTGSATS